MQDNKLKDIFTSFQDHLNNEQELREQIRANVKQIDQHVKDAAIALQIIHTTKKEVSNACLKAREQFELCKNGFEELVKIVPPGQFYRFNDQWHLVTQRIVFLIGLTIYLEAGFLVSRETVAEMLGIHTSKFEGFHLDLEVYLLGLLLLASELSRFAINAVILGDYERPMNISRFVADLNAGFRLLNLKNDNLRNRYDALKYDVKKIEEIVYDISVRGLRPEQLLADVNTADDDNE